MCVCNECCLLSGRGICVRMITCLEECGVFDCNHEASIMRRPWPIKGCCTMKNKTMMGILAGKLCQGIYDL